MIDTGSKFTLLHADVWQLLPDSVRRSLEPCNLPLVGAGGEPLKMQGKGVVNLALGKVRTKHTIYVANIVNSGILGIDFLKGHGGILDLHNGYLQFGSEYVKLLHEDQLAMTKCCKVTLAETVTIPPGSEMILPGKIHVPCPDMKEGVIEVSTKFQEKDLGLLVAHTFVKVKTNAKVPVPVMNSQQEPVTVYEGTGLGLLHPSEEVEFGNCNGGTNGEHHSPIGELFNHSTKDLDDSEKERVWQFLERNRDVFSLEGELGRTNRVFHHIETGDAAPIKQHARRFPVAQRAEVENKVQEMLNADIITPSISPWSSPIVLVRKKDGSTRFCTDYRKLNEVTRKDSYPLPRIEESLEALGGSKWFSTLDLASGYWQVEVAPEDRPKTAFTTGRQLFEYKVLPFGLTGAPATFERLMDNVLAGLHWETCLVYLDDIIVFSESFDSHLEKLQQVFDRLKGANLKLKPTKCSLFKRKVKYLGHVVSSEGICTDPEKVEVIENWLTPSNVTEVRKFLGLCSYYRKFVKNFGQTAAPLHHLTQKEVGFRWTEEHSKAFRDLKAALTSSPILAYPDFSQQFVLDTDASNGAIGAVLSQVGADGKEHVIAYASKKLAKSEVKYSTTRKELLAVVKFVKQFRHYLLGRKFVLRTDHNSLRWLFQFKEPEGQVARWLEFLSEYDFEIVHRAGTQHGNADALSRMPLVKEEMVQTEELQRGREVCAPVVLAGDKGDLLAAQKADQHLKPVIQWLEEGLRPSNHDVSAFSRETKAYWFLWDQLKLVNGVLSREFYHDNPNQGVKFRQIVVPKAMRQEVFLKAHSSVTGGHLGRVRTFAKVQQQYFWIGYREDIGLWVRQCTKCAKRKSPTRRPRAALANFNYVGFPMERVAIDIMGPLPMSKRGNKFVLVVTDYFTKWAEAYALPNQEAVTCADVLVKEFFCRFGVPYSIHSDQGRNFESGLFQEVCKLLDINKTKTTAYHPQSDGLVERLNRTLATKC